MVPFVTDADFDAILGPIQMAATAILSLLGIAVVGLAIYIGFKMATASDDSKRKDAKRQLIFAIVGAVAILLIIILFNTAVMPAIENAIQGN